MIEIRAYVGVDGRSQYETWFSSLDASVAAKITVAITRMAQGNLGKSEPVESGVSEKKLDVGPGYRIYFARDGDRLIILLGGGSKKRQQKDIDAAKANWTEYKERKKEK